MTQPTVLEYAHHYGLAIDHQKHDLFHHVRQVAQRNKDPNPLTGSHDHQPLLESFSTAARELSNSTCTDLQALPQATTDVLRQATTYEKPNLIELSGYLLPHPAGNKRFKLPLPMLSAGGGDVRRDVNKVRAGLDLEQLVRDVSEDYADTVNCDKFDQSWNLVLPLINRMAQEEVQSESIAHRPLAVTAKTLAYLQHASPIRISHQDWLVATDTHILGSNSMLRPTVVNFDVSDFNFDEDIHEGIEEAKVVESSPGTQFNVNTCDSLSMATEQQMPEDQGTSSPRPKYSVIASSSMSPVVSEIFEQTHHRDQSSTSNEAGHLEKNRMKDQRSPCSSSPPRKKVKLSLSNLPEHVQETRTDISVISKPSDIVGIDAFKLHAKAPSSSNITLPDIYIAEITKNFGTLNERISIGTPELDERNWSLPPSSSMKEIFKPQTPYTSALLERMFEQPERVLRSSDMLWKEPGLRILVGSDEDVGKIVTEDFEFELEIEHLVSDPNNLRIDTRPDQQLIGKTMSNVGLVRSPSQSTPSKGIESARSHGLDQPKDSAKAGSTITYAKKRENITVEGQPAKALKRTPGVLYKSQAPSGIRKASYFESDPLSAFLFLRGKQFKSPAWKNCIRQEGILDDPIQSSQLAENEPQPQQTKTNTAQDGIPADCAPYQWRNIQINTISDQRYRTIFLNNSLLLEKPLLVRYLENVNSEHLALIYRNLDTTTAKGPDLILNTTTCLICTSLQALSQRPLPGQQSTSGLSCVHDRISAATSTYDHVYILVHFVPVNEIVAFQKMSTVQLEFGKFCKSLSSYQPRNKIQVTPIWLPCIQISAVAGLVNSWSWRTIQQYAYSRPVVTTETLGAFIQDETVWELLLVKAQLNTMAAQAVISVIKSFEGDGACLGLRGLLRMEVKEMHHTFDNVIGERAVYRLYQNLNTQ